MPGRRNAAEHGKSHLSVNVEGAPRRRMGWLVWPLVGLLAVAIIGAVAFALAWQGQYAGRVYAGVSVLDTDLSGKSSEEAEKLLRDKVAAFVGQPVVLAWRGKEWRPTAEQLGIKVDVEGSVDEAFRVGRGSDPLGNVAQQWAAAQDGYRVPLTVQISEPALQGYLNGIADAEINQELFEGDVRLNATEVVGLPGKEGRTLKVYDAIKSIREQVARLEQGKVELPVEIVQPTVTAEEVAYIQGLLGVRVSAPLTATVPVSGGETFTLDRDAIVRFTTIERNPDRTASRHIELGWNDRELHILGERWAEEANRPAKNARFAWNGGALAVLSESVEGFEIDAATVITSIKEHAGTSDKREYLLPGKVITPTVSSKDLGALGIRELMGTGTSTFRGSSQERATNIRVAAELLNGAVVPPGGTFSFLETMGGIDEAHGFVEGYVIAAERTQRGVGGGVCQVSTTAFRGAFWAGMEITERNPHSYRVGWYEANGEPVGFDAAVFDPGVDLKFINNSSGYVLIEAGVGDGTLTVNYYGTKLPGEVRLEGPAISNRTPPPPDVYQVDDRLPPGTKKQVETARAGLDTVITRRIIVPGQPDKVDQFHSSYKAWPNWYIVASSSQIPGGAQPAFNPTPNP
jgi:vancomycin resistance protein YoaR